MVAEAVGIGHAVVMLETLVMLGLRRVLMRVLRVIEEHVWYSPARPIEAGIMSLLMALRVHAEDSATARRCRAMTALVEEHGSPR